jgi:hypothetical protein
MNVITRRLPPKENQQNAGAKNKNQTVTTKARVAKRSAKTASQKPEPAPQAASAKKPRHSRPRRQQNGQDPRPAETPRWRHFERTRQANRLAAKLSAWLLERSDRQEDGNAR